jgi:hypothetical protein
VIFANISTKVSLIYRLTRPETARDLALGD